MSDTAERGNSWVALTRWMHHPDVNAAKRAAELAAAECATIEGASEPLTYEQRATVRRLVAAEAAYVKAKLKAIAIDLEQPLENC